MNIIVVLLSTLIIISCSQLNPELNNNYDGVIYDYDVEKTNQYENVNDEPLIPAGFQKGQPNQIDSYGRCIEWNEETKQAQLCAGLTCSTLTEEDCREDEMCFLEGYKCMKAKFIYCRHPDKNINSLHREGELFDHCWCICECYFGECRTVCQKKICSCDSCKKGECDTSFATCSWNDKHGCISDKEGKHRVVKMKIFLDDLLVAKYKEMFGEKYKEEATNIIKKIINSASKYLKELDAGGYITKMDEPLLLLSESPYKIGNTYIARQTNNLKHDLEKTDIIGYSFAFQEAVDYAEYHQQSPDTILFILTPRERNSNPSAAVEELCLCKNPPPFPCTGIFSMKKEPDYEMSGMLLAHEIGHALGVKEHDSTYGTIMYGTVSGGYWSQFSKDQINKQNNSCLKDTESSQQYFESGIMETDAKNPPRDDRLSYYRSSYLLA